MSALAEARMSIRSQHLANEETILEALRQEASFDTEYHSAATDRAVGLVKSIRNNSAPGLMEVFLAEYGLSTDEGVALMCLAEALLRVPDAHTIDALIEDKIAPSEWGAHLGKSSSSLVNASTWALMLTGKVLQNGDGIASVLRGAVKRVGEPVIRTAVSRAMRELGAQFVLGETIDEAVKKGEPCKSKGYTYSYDMLGEAALTAQDATSYFEAYSDAITTLANRAESDDIRKNPGISIKLSALHPRYEVSQHDRVLSELTPRVLSLAKQAKSARMGLNVDAEESERLEISLDVIEAVLSSSELEGWDGFGVVVQAYGKRAMPVIDWLKALAEKLDRKIMVRLVKGAYWDSEIKRAQVEGLTSFPVFTRKAATDVSYLCCAAKLLRETDHVYPQFATHNAHSVAAILEMGADSRTYEFQRLHGMGEALHDTVLVQSKTRCRIYAPVGSHEDLLAYLVRRLLENGANSSFVNQIVDEDVPPVEVAADPFETLKVSGAFVAEPSRLYAPERLNSQGWDLHNSHDLETIEKARWPFLTSDWTAAPLTVNDAVDSGSIDVCNPARPSEILGSVRYASEDEARFAIQSSAIWDASPEMRAKTLIKASDLYEENFGEMFALLTREAGKTLMDAVAELREAVDFLRYYAARAPQTAPPRGIFTCISPWNFPLAIFTGQIAAALAAGNAVIAKPAESTNLIAYKAVSLLHQAGVPITALQLLPGRGDAIGPALTSDPALGGVCFTGSTATAKSINRAMAVNVSPAAPLIAETGGINTMIVDSTALPEQAVKDIVTSAFQSAGQRCSALRMLYLQEDIADPFLRMLFGAMDELVVGDPWDLATDVGPTIDKNAQAGILAHIKLAESDGRVLKTVAVQNDGYFTPPTAVEVTGISDLDREVFGPVLHIARFGAQELDRVIDDINVSGYGLTFGLHSRLDDRVAQLSKRLHVGNMYINRNQIGAVVGSQPFGGEGLSGTGPKAGGPAYVKRFSKVDRRIQESAEGKRIDADEIQKRLDELVHVPKMLSSMSLPGPTGESNRLSIYGRGVVLCLGPTRLAALEQAAAARRAGCVPLCIAPGLNAEEGFDGVIAPEVLIKLQGFDVVASMLSDAELKPFCVALAEREGKLIPLLCEQDFSERMTRERHVCIDTTAAGGNASLLAQG